MSDHHFDNMQALDTRLQGEGYTLAHSGRAILTRHDEGGTFPVALAIDDGEPNLTVIPPEVQAHPDAQELLRDRERLLKILHDEYAEIPPDLLTMFSVLLHIAPKNTEITLCEVRVYCTDPGVWKVVIGCDMAVALIPHLKRSMERTHSRVERDICGIVPTRAGGSRKPRRRWK